MMYCWGRGEDGQLGLGDTCDQSTPTLVGSLKEIRVVQIACGSGHTVVLADDGCVFTWGRGDDGRLGHADHGWKYVPRLVDALRSVPITKITCGSYHTAAIAETGQLFTWGGGMFGKLGHGNDRGHSTPQLVAFLKAFTVLDVACGSRHTICCTKEDKVYTWGAQENGVAGHGKPAGDPPGPLLVPVEVAALTDKGAIQVSACGFHSAALTESGNIYSWGEGRFGRLGHGDEAHRYVPTMIKSVSAVQMVQVACGGFHSASISRDGRVYTWGGGEHGQLGHGDKVNKTTPCVVSMLSSTRCTQVACGWSHTVALSDTQEVYTWGNGDHGKLGCGDASKVTLPQRVEALSGLKICQVASYNEHTAALTEHSAQSSASSDEAALAADLAQLVNNPDHADVTFLVEGSRVYAHRAILAARSDHFKAMFESGMKESEADEIELPDATKEAFIAMLDYVYTGRLKVGPDTAIHVYVAAEIYMIPKLKARCEDIVRATIDVSTAAHLLSVADALPHAGGMTSLCMTFIVRHFDAVTKTEGFQNMSRQLILEVLQAR